MASIPNLSKRGLKQIRVRAGGRPVEIVLTALSVGFAIGVTGVPPYCLIACVCAALYLVILGLWGTMNVPRIFCGTLALTAPMGWLPWPVPVLLSAVTVYLMSCGQRAWLRGGIAELGTCTLRRRQAIAIVSISAATALSCVLAFTLTRFNLSDDFQYLDITKPPSWMLALVAGIAALLNALSEEYVWRGVLWRWLSDSLESLPLFSLNFIVISATSVSFGMSHFANGLPSGWSGAGAAVLLGVFLGLVRAHTRGLLLPVAIHTCIDFTIFWVFLGHLVFRPV